MFSIKLVLTSIVSLLLVSCGANSDLLKVANKLTEDAVAETTFFQLNQNSLVVSNAEQSVSAVSFTTKDAQSWKVESSTSFCILKDTKTEGVGSSTISVFLTENKETASRTCSIAFTVPGMFPAPVLNITQMGVAPFLSVNTSSIILPNANPSSIVVVSNTNWSATSSVSWCKISTANEVASNSIKGSGTLQVSIRVEANTDSKIRSCVLSFSAEGILPLQSIVTQFGTNDSVVVQDSNVVSNINISTTSLTESNIRFVSNTTSDVTLASNTTNYTFNVTSNVAYTVTVPIQQWLRVNTSNRVGAGNTSSNIGLFLQPNTSNDDRSVNVVITAGSVQKIITIHQKGTLPHIILSSKQFNALSMSTGVSVGVQSSTGWRASVTNGISWCKVNSTNNSFTVNTLSNTGSTSRVCTVKVSTITGGVSSDFTLTQLGSNTSVLINNTTDLNIPYHGSIILEKLITANTGYTVSSNNSINCYLPLTSYNAGVDVPVIVSLPLNSRSVARSCTITVSANGVSRQFVIKQDAKPAVLNVNASTVTVLPNDTSTSGVSIVVDSTVDWTATVTSGSCAVTPVSSINDTENITISGFGSSNSSSTLDVCTVTFSGSGVTSKTVSIKQLGGNDSLVLSEIEDTIDYTKNSSDFSLTTNASWRISSLSNTCTVATVATPSTALTSGLAGNHSLRIAFISTEASATERTCSATFTTTVGTGGTASQTYTLTKAQTPTITLVAGSGQTLTSGNLTQNVASIASTVSFPVTLATASETMAVTFKSNVAWSITSDQSYCMVDANNNSGNGAGTDDISKNITVLANLSTTTRTCTFTFSGTDAVDKTLTITQYGQAILVGSSSNNVFSTVNLLVRTTSSNTLNALGSIPAVSSTSTSVSYNVLVASGRSAELSVSNANTLGCTGSLYLAGSASVVSSGTISYNFTENTTRTARSCTVQFNAYPNISRGGTVASVTSTINQGATDIYIKTNTADTQYLSSVSLLYSDRQTTFKVRANGGYTSTVSSQTSGMSCTVSNNATASDDTEKDVIVQFRANLSLSVIASCTIQFTSVTSAVVRSINITQTVLPPNTALDTDGDGLINITNQAQFLNMKYNLAGTSYKTSAADSGVSVGCPVSGCFGYELDNEIKFGFATGACTIPTNTNNNSLAEPIIINYNGSDLALHTNITGGAPFPYFGSSASFGIRGSVTFSNTGYGSSMDITYRAVSTFVNILPFDTATCTVDITQPSTALTGFTGTFEGNGFNVSGMRIANGVRTTSASTYFTSGTIRNVTFR